MLTITLETEVFDETTQKFSTINNGTINLEHSLLSLSKWESEFQIPFLGSNEKTTEQVLKYIKYMICTENVTTEQFDELVLNHILKITEYIESKQTATFFGTLPKKPGRVETITSELIYFWMFSYRIPFECENWHLNRLFALIQIFNVKNAKQEKTPRSEIMSRNRALNEQRKAQLKTTG